MHPLTKLLIGAAAFAGIQTLNVAVFRSPTSVMSAAFCWLVVAAIAWRRCATLKP